MQYLIDHWLGLAILVVLIYFIFRVDRLIRQLKDHIEERDYRASKQAEAMATKALGLEDKK